MSKTKSFDANKKKQWREFVQQLSPESNPASIRLMGQLRMVSHMLYQSAESRLGRAGLSYAQFRILLMLLFKARMENQTALNPSEISSLHGTSRNTVSSLIRSLEKDGLIKRQLDENDRRRFNISLTDAGKDCVMAHMQDHFETLNNAFSSLTLVEINTLNNLLEKISSAETSDPTCATDEK